LLIFVGEEKQFSLAVSFNALFKLAFDKIKECKRELRGFFSGTDISMEEFIHEGDLMLEYFRNSTPQASSDSADDICELILALMEMDLFDDRHPGLPPSSIKTVDYMEMKRRRSRRTARRIAEGIDVTGEVIGARLDTLLAARDESIKQWIDGGKPTSKFEEVFRTVHLTHIRRMRTTSSRKLRKEGWNVRDCTPLSMVSS
jgi:succinate dehydrogenase flavin-adding protein (antitoxin of CptAB toxin-antitoxin module)